MRERATEMSIAVAPSDATMLETKSALPLGKNWESHKETLRIDSKSDQAALRNGA